MKQFQNFVSNYVEFHSFVDDMIFQNTAVFRKYEHNSPLISEFVSISSLEIFSAVNNRGTVCDSLRESISFLPEITTLSNVFKV